MANLKIVFDPSSNKRVLKSDSEHEVPFSFKNVDEKTLEINGINNNDGDHYTNYMIPYIPKEDERYLPLPSGSIGTLLDSPSVSDNSSHKNDEDFNDIESDCSFTPEEEDRLLDVETSNDPESKTCVERGSFLVTVPILDNVLQKWNKRPDNIFKESHIIDSNFTGFICEETDVRSRSSDFFKVPVRPLKRHTIPSVSTTNKSSSKSTTNRFSPNKINDNFLTNNFTHQDDDIISLCASTLRDPDEYSDTSESSDDERTPARFKRHRSVDIEGSPVAEREENNFVECIELENQRAITPDNCGSSKSGSLRFEPPSGVTTTELEASMTNNSVCIQDVRIVSSKEFNYHLPNVNLQSHREWVDFRTVSPFFFGLCYHHWLKNNCNRVNCPKAHDINLETFKTKCQNTSREVLCNLYNFTLRFKYFYQNIYQAFLHGFGFYNMQHELLSCIKDFFSMEVNIPEAITQLLQELQRHDMKLIDAVEMIIYKMGCDNYPTLSEILLDILCQTVDITENWTMIRKIIKYRNDIPSELANRILHRITTKYPCNRTVCMELHKLFFTDRKVDASQINPDLKKAIQTMVNFCNKTPSPTAPVPNKTPSELSYSSGNNSLEDNIPKSTAIENNKNSSLNFIPLRTYKSNRNLNNHNATPSGSIQQLPNKKIDLLPTVSILKKTTYDAAFVLDVSLHHLMPNVVQQAHMNEMDKCKLKDAIRSGNGSRFLEILKKNKSPSVFYNFAVEAFRCIRSMGNSYTKLNKLEHSIKQIKPTYNNDLHLKVIFEVIVMNLLLHLEDKGYWADATMLISHFRDWDSLVSSQLFRTFAPRNFTLSGRYILLAKLLAKGCNFSLTYEILMQGELGLLKPNNDFNDFNEESRDEVIMDFLTFGYKMKGKDNMLMTIDIFRNIIINNLIKPSFKKRLDTCLKFYIRESRIQDLRCFFEHIEVFYEHIELNALRSFAITIYPHLSDEHNSVLYDYCAKRKIYPRLTGQENFIRVKTNMIDAEISLLFTTYFYKLSKINYLIQRDLRIEIVLSDNVNEDLNLCKYTTNELTRTVLFQKFGLMLPNLNDFQYIIIPKTEILKKLRK